MMMIRNMMMILVIGQKIVLVFVFYNKFHPNQMVQQKGIRAAWQAVKMEQLPIRGGTRGHQIFCFRQPYVSHRKCILFFLYTVRARPIERMKPFSRNIANQ